MSSENIDWENLIPKRGDAVDDDDDDDDDLNAHELAEHILWRALEKQDPESATTEFRLEAAKILFLNSISMSLRLMAMSESERIVYDHNKHEREWRKIFEQEGRVFAEAKKWTCSSCNARPGEDCHTQAGKKSPRPHMPRVHLAEEALEDQE